MKEALIEKGWFKTGGCSCGGVKREEYQHSDYPGVIVKIYPTRLKYRISRAGRKLFEGPAGQIETHINAITQ